MEKIKIKINKANIIKGVHPLFKFISLLIIFFSLTTTKSFTVIAIYFVISLIILFFTQSFKISQFKDILPFLFLVVIYSIVLSFSNVLPPTQIIKQIITRIFMLLAIFNFSYIFIKNSSKYQLLKISVFILYPFTLFIDKSIVTKIMLNTISITPKILDRFKNLMSFYKSSKGFRFIIKLIDIVTEFFITIINDPPEMKGISKERLYKISKFRKPVLQDYIFLSTIMVISIGISSF